MYIGMLYGTIQVSDRRYKIKELLDYSDDDMVEGLMLDVRLQYALHTTSFEEQPLSDKSLRHFRKRCYAYEQETGNDLMYTCIVSLSWEIVRIMKISGSGGCCKDRKEYQLFSRCISEQTVSEEGKRRLAMQISRFKI